MKALLLLLLVAAALSRTETLTGKAVRLKDGDSFFLLAGGKEHEVRFTGIDCPEMDQRPHGEKARESLEALVKGKTVTFAWHKRDPWKRLVGKGTVDGGDLALAQLASGRCFYFRRYAKELSAADREAYAAAEAEAKSAKRGVWTDPDLAKPWDYRRSKGKKRRK